MAVLLYNKGDILRRKDGGDVAILNVGKASLLGKAYKTLQDAVNDAIDGDIIQINQKKIVIDKPIQNFNSGVRVQGNPNNRPVEVFTPPRNTGIYLGSGQTNMEFVNLAFVVPEQAYGISVSYGGSIKFDNTTMFHQGNITERTIRPSLAFTVGNNPQGLAKLELRNSAIDVVSFMGSQFTMNGSNIGNILGASNFSKHTVSVITAPVVQIQQSGVQHVGFMASYDSRMKPFEQPMVMSGSYIGANTIIQRKAMLNQMVITPVVAINQQRQFINYPAERNYMPGLIVTGPNAKVSLDQVAIFDHFTKEDAQKSVFANNYAVVLNAVKNMVPFSPLQVFNKGTLQIKNSQIPLTDAANIAESGKLILDHVTDQSMWDVADSKKVELVNRGSSSSLFQQSQQDDLMDDTDGKKNESAMEQLHEMIGLEPVKQFADDFVARMAMQKQRQKAGLTNGKDGIQSMHAVFSGPAGVGKTTVAELFGKALYEAHVLPTPNVNKVSAADLVSDHVGETAKNVKKVIHDAFGGVLFIDEAYVLAPDKNGGGNSFKDEAVTEIVNEADEYRDKLMIIMAGYTNEMVDFFKRGNPGLRSRFANWIEFPPYSIEDLKKMMYLMLKKANAVVADAPTRKALERGIDHLVGQQGEASGQGRFVRNYIDAVCGARDVRLMKEQQAGKQISTRDLTVIKASDAMAATKKMHARMGVFR